MTASGLDEKTRDFMKARAKDYPAGSGGQPKGIRTITGGRLYPTDVMDGYFFIGDNRESTEPVLSIIGLTGPLPKNGERIINLLEPAIQGGYVGYLVTYLTSLKDWAQYENLIEAYKKGTISPALLDILKEEPPAPNEEIMHRRMGGGATIYKLAQEGRLDFEPFRGEKDTETDWLFFYRLSFTPLQGIRRGLDDIARMIEPSKAATLAHLKTQVKILLQGEKRAPAILKKIKEQIDGEPAGEYIIPPVPAEDLERFAAAIELQYKNRCRGKTPKDFSSPFIGKLDTGFYVNPATLSITDLRPFQEELHSLLAVKSWAYIKDFVQAIREAIAEFTGAAEQEEKPPSIFDSAFIKMLNANPVNAIVNINTSPSGRPGNQYGEQNLFTKEWEFKTDKTELNFPIKAVGHTVLPPEFTSSTWKTMHLIMLLFTAKNSHRRGADVWPVVETSVREYMFATGRKITTTNVKNTTRTLKKDLALLNEIKIKSTDKKYSLDLVRPFPGVHMNRGKIRITLEPSFANYLAIKTGLLMNYPAALLKLKENNSNLYPLGYKLALYRSNDANIRRGKANVLSVETCLDWCPGIPSIEDVRKQRNSPAKRIIEPFEKALDALQEQGILERWEYCLPKGEPLKDAAVTDYNYFISLLISYEIKDFPVKDELPRIQENAERQRKRKERIDRYTEKNIAKQRAKAAENKT